MLCTLSQSMLTILSGLLINVGVFYMSTIYYRLEQMRLEKANKAAAKTAGQEKEKVTTKAAKTASSSSTTTAAGGGKDKPSKKDKDG